MSLHTKLTMIILFINICLTVLVPNLVSFEQQFWYKNSNGDYGITNDIDTAVGGVTPNKEGLYNDFKLTDVFLLLSSIISIVVSLFGASLFILFYLPGEWGLILGIPLIIAYFLAFAGWVRNG